MAVTFHPVTTPEEVDDLARLAGQIWREYWPALIGEAQTEYNRLKPSSAIWQSMITATGSWWTTS